MSSSGTPAPGSRGSPTPTPAGAVRDGELRLDLHGEKLRGRFVLVRTGPAGAGREEWLLLHKRDEFAAPGWDADDHPRSVLSGRTNDEVSADPDRLWRSDQPAARATVRLRSGEVTADELAELDALRDGGRWHVFGRELRVTNLGKVLFPARAGEAPVTKRELLRYTAQVAPTALPYLNRRALNLHRYPNGAQAKGFWHKQLPAPISWDELDDPSLRPDGFTVRSMPQRLAEHGDLFRDALTHTQRLPQLHQRR
jgi:bifunctional non-homologous end joining protein LigD